MTSNTLGDFLKSESRDVDPIIQEVSIFKQLIKERVHPLDLVRELLSNAGAQEVGATIIEISYTKDKEGHIFEISDDGCGMEFTGNVQLPGRLDKFLGLGLSGIIGLSHDEFSWKGLGSKLSFQSRRVEIETCQGGESPLYIVRVNEPWGTIERNEVPKPKLNQHPSEGRGTKIRIIGHPPHRLEDPFSLNEIRIFLQHRTFAGYTRKRDNPPKITLSVLGETKKINFGLPEFKNFDFDSIEHNEYLLDESTQTLFVNVKNPKGKGMSVRVKGILTWDTKTFSLSRANLNTGLILSVKGIPYFNLNMEDFGVTTIRTARPGENKTCLVVECDSIQEELNISRSGLVDSPKSLELRKIVTEIFQRIESSDEYLKFRRIPEKDKLSKSSDYLKEEKDKIAEKDQNWVVLEKGGELKVLIREPQSEAEVNAIIWKLEALNALPFERFKTLAYVGAARGPDLLVNYQEERGSEPQISTVFEIENNFYNYSLHGHTPSQYPKVICWDAPTSGRKIKLTKTSKRYKYTSTNEEFQIHVFIIKYFDGVKVLSRRELEELGVEF